MDDQLENFREAFSPSCGRYHDVCECGKEFYNSTGGWDWDDGQLESLQNDPEAEDLEYPVSTVEFEGREYMWDCNCWHERARKILDFINNHAHEIARYINLEQERLQHIADHAPRINKPRGNNTSKAEAMDNEARRINLSRIPAKHRAATWKRLVDWYPKIAAWCADPFVRAVKVTFDGELIIELPGIYSSFEEVTRAIQRAKSKREIKKIIDETERRWQADQLPVTDDQWLRLTTCVYLRVQQLEQIQLKNAQQP